MNLDHDEQREALDALLDNIDEMCEAYMTEPDANFPAMGFALTEEGVGLIPLAHLLRDEMTARAVCNLILPRVVQQSNAFGFAVGMTVWRETDEMHEQLQTPDVRKLKTDADEEEYGGQPEAIMVMLGFNDSTMRVAERNITRVENQAPDLGDWEGITHNEWQGMSGALLDSAMEVLTGVQVYAPETISELSAMLAQNDALVEEAGRWLAEPGWSLEEVNRTIDENKGVTPELELAVMGMPDEFKMKVVAMAQEHAPSLGEAQFRAAMAERYAQERAPFMGLPNEIKERMNR